MVRLWREAVVRLSGRPLRRKALKKIQDPPIPFSAAEIPRLRTSLAPIGPGPSRCTAYAKLSGEGLATHSAELRLVDQTDVVGFPQHAFNLAVTIARCESRGRVAKCIASLYVGPMG